MPVPGTARQIASTKFPIYRGKRIIGLLGYFEDVDESSRHQAQLHTVSLIDAETGLLNFRGLLLVGEDYMEAYRRYGTDYVCVVLEVPEYEQVFRDYGDEVAGKLLQAITDQLLTLHSLKGSLAHLSGCRFFYITHQSLDRDFRNTLLGLTNAIHSLTDIGGYSCTLYLQYAIVQGSEGRDFDEIMQLLRERLKDAEEQRYGQAVYIGDRLVFDKEKFDKLDEEVSIIDPDTYELVYVNDYMQRAYGLSDSSSWVGRNVIKSWLTGRLPAIIASMTGCAAIVLYGNAPQPQDRAIPVHADDAHSLAGEELPFFYGFRPEPVYFPRPGRN